MILQEAEALRSESRDSYPSPANAGDVTFSKLSTHATPAFSSIKQGQPHLTGLLQELSPFSLFYVVHIE